LRRLSRHAATLGRFAREQILVVGTGVLAAVFLLTGRVTPRTAWRSIDVDLLLVLFALLVAVETLRESGWLDFAVARTVSRFDHTRPFAVMLLAMTGVLAALVTNDVTLFIVIPFTLAASRMSPFDVEDAIVLEVVAANLVGCLTPLGNPQNLFIYHQSGWNAWRFIATMLPFVSICVAGLLVAVFFLGRSQPLDQQQFELPPRDRRAAIAGAVTFALVLLEIARVLDARPAAITALVAGIFVLRQRFFDIDLSIVPLFFFAFIVVEGLRTLPLDLIARSQTYFTSIALSQVISNVPAAVLLTPFARGDWRTLLYGVNAGGCGTIVASLANLLGWRIYARESGRDPRFFWRLTAINFAFLAWAGLGGWALLQIHA
jgi:Na+/H+ antiporter NhaD/arsenite permease-like protein